MSACHPIPPPSGVFCPGGYLLTVVVELPVLLVGLSRRHSIRDRILAGLALTAFTYPIVVCVLRSLDAPAPVFT